MGSAAATEVDRKVAELIVPEIPNGACLQLGIGGMPNTIGAMIAESDLKDLGVHTEMYVDAFVDIAKAGKITGRNKNIDRGRQAYAFAAGTKKLYDYLDNNPECASMPVDYTNDVHVIAGIDNFISINNAVDIDLYGQVNAESAGTKQISGTGRPARLRHGRLPVQGWQELHLPVLDLQAEGWHGRIPYPSDTGKRLDRDRSAHDHTLYRNRVRYGQPQGQVHVAARRGPDFGGASGLP